MTEGFRMFADANNCTLRAAYNKYYNKQRNNRIKDKYPIFGVFSRYRAVPNAKIYQKEQSKGYSFWKVIKKVFGYK